MRLAFFLNLVPPSRPWLRFTKTTTRFCVLTGCPTQGSGHHEKLLALLVKFHWDIWNGAGRTIKNGWDLKASKRKERTEVETGVLSLQLKKNSSGDFISWSPPNPRLVGSRCDGFAPNLIDVKLEHHGGYIAYSSPWDCNDTAKTSHPWLHFRCWRGNQIGVGYYSVRTLQWEILICSEAVCQCSRSARTSLLQHCIGCPRYIVKTVLGVLAIKQDHWIGWRLLFQRLRSLFLNGNKALLWIFPPQQLHFLSSRSRLIRIAEYSFTSEREMSSCFLIREREPIEISKD
jgi:hypothetical protein